MVALQKLGRLVLLAPLLLALVACNEETLYAKLSERDANDMVALLLSSGISASKTADKDGQYKVITDSAHFAQAINLLHINGFPKESYRSLGSVFPKKGFGSSQLEERARLNYALSQELASTLSNIDGVLVARVHLAVPPVNDLTDKAAPASASVFIKHRGDVDLSASTGMIKNLVVNGIENLSYENVTVAFFKSGANTSVPAESAAASVALQVSQGRAGNGVLQNMQLGFFSSVQPSHMALGALFVGLLLVLGSFRRRKPTEQQSMNAVRVDSSRESES